MEVPQQRATNIGDERQATGRYEYEGVTGMLFLTGDRRVFVSHCHHPGQTAAHRRIAGRRRRGYGSTRRMTVRDDGRRRMTVQRGSPAVEHHAPTIYQHVENPTALVLMLHGGRARGANPPTALNLPSRRLRPFATTIARTSVGERAVIAQVTYRYRGWNGRRADAAVDAQVALDHLLDTYGALPVVLVGHSMGGRAALHIGGHAAVHGVVALAPWCPEYEPTVQLAGQRAVLLHSDRDRMTDPLASWGFVARAKADGARVCGVEITGSDHAMLRRSAAWHDLVGRLVVGMLDPDAMPPEVSAALGSELEPVVTYQPLLLGDIPAPQSR